ncbi:alpha-tocopherol transfer protein-like [Photinus pyralis]|uniref:alpha-tocopherol transfer protein-like n=1 Tax=Photinus pyralis TaxID=7054 RepID=UPI0012670707|nr:alpha-tocopherol transfer protein-like [Photinus pyralis]
MIESTEIEERAKRELGETPEIRENGLREIKEWLREQNLQHDCLSELGLLNFLRGCKFAQERTRDKLFHYLSSKSSKSDVLMSDRDPYSDELREVLSKGMLLFLSSENYETLLIRWENCDTKKVSLVNVIKVGLMAFEVLINESPTVMISGHTIIIDCTNLPFGYIRQVSPSLVKEIFRIIWKAYPIRIRAVHIINCIPFMGLIFSMFKPFIPLKIVSRVRFYSSSNANRLYTDFPLSELPRDYGGEATSIDSLTETTKRMVEERRHWFVNQEDNTSDKDDYVNQLIIN